MKERVSIITGNSPILIVCPHGPDDTNTSTIAKICAKETGASAIINNGWKRSKTIDEDKSKANCNSVAQIFDKNNSVVFSEYTQPLMQNLEKIVKQHQDHVYVFHIHGIGDHISKNQTTPIGFVMGFGQAKNKPLHTCPLWLKNSFAEYINYKNFRGYAAAQGKKGGYYCARRKDNVVQALRKIHKNSPSSCVLSNLQIEINYELRENKNIAKVTGEYLSDFIKSLLTLDPKVAANEAYNKVPII